MGNNNQKRDKEEMPESLKPVLLPGEEVPLSEKINDLKDYKERLDKLSRVSSTAFETMNKINRLVVKNVVEFEISVTKSEENFKKALERDSKLPSVANTLNDK